MKTIHLLLATSLVLGLVGCANLQLYDGPKQPENAVIMINGMSNMDISAGGFAVKVCKFDGKDLGSCQPFIEFLPGTHTLTIELTNLGIQVGDDVDVTKDFVAGDRYELDVGFAGAQHPVMVFTGNVNRKESGGKN